VHITTTRLCREHTSKTGPLVYAKTIKAGDGITCRNAAAENSSKRRRMVSIIYYYLRHRRKMVQQTPKKTQNILSLLSTHRCNCQFE